ncbi:MAG TPA: methionyl-tRNA formyltransferase [Actinomycetes bacterium]|jgi:methionyl-tRNA formyltransferase|nr:methionyl-tRNA formyltransferase [Actinomycetes bacterium]
MRVVYLGTPAAAVPPLEALLDSTHEVVAVVTRPDRPRDRRGGPPRPSPVKQAALAAGVPVLEPPSGRDPELPARLAATGADIGVACAFGYLLPDAVLAALPRGIINLHFSLLPAYRGAAPVQRALLDGVEVTGVTTFQIDAGMDTGPMLLAAQVAVDPREDAGALTARLAEVGARLTVETLDALAAGQLQPRPQPEAGASLAPKVTGEEARLDFSWPAARLADAVRAFTPAPGAWTTHRGRRLKVARATPAEGSGASLPEDGRPTLEPGRLALGPGGRLLVGAADQPLELLEVQPEGRRAMSGAEFARGARLGPDEWLGR